MAYITNELMSSLPNKTLKLRENLNRRIKQWVGICCNCRLDKVFIKELDSLKWFLYLVTNYSHAFSSFCFWHYNWP